MINVVYCKEGKPISDFEVNNYVDSMIHFHKFNGNLLIHTSSELCFMVFGLRVLEDKISINEIEFYVNDRKIEFHPYLGLYDPNDNIGFFTQVCNKALKLGYQKMKGQKNE